MTVLIILGLCALALSITFVVVAIRWTLRQVNADDCCLDLEDCL